MESKSKVKSKSKLEIKQENANEEKTFMSEALGARENKNESERI